MPSDPPSEVQITVTVSPSDRARRMPKRYVIAALVCVSAVSAAIAVLGAAAGRSPATGLSAREAAHVAAAFGSAYPRRCLAIASYGSFARAHVIRTGGCARYRGYLNATFHFIGGRWRLVLDEGQLFVPNADLVETH